MPFKGDVVLSFSAGLPDTVVDDHEHEANSKNVGKSRKSTSQNSKVSASTRLMPESEPQDFVQPKKKRKKKKQATQPKRLVLMPITYRTPKYMILGRDSQMEIVKKEILGHCWTNAANCLPMILRDSRIHHPLLFKYAILVVLHRRPATMTIPQLFTSTIRPLINKFMAMFVNRIEVLLDMFCFLVCNGMLKQAEDLINEHPRAIRDMSKARVKGTRYTYRMTPFVNSCFRCYREYIQYLQWKEGSMTDKDQARQLVDVFKHHISEAFHNPRLSLFSDCLLDLTYDLLNILNSQANDEDDPDEADRLIIQQQQLKEETIGFFYESVKKQPEDLCVLLRYYQTVCDFGALKEDATRESISQRIKFFLEKFLVISPDHPVVKELLQRQTSSFNPNEPLSCNDLIECIKALMNYLDFEQNRYELEAWEMLSQLIVQAKRTYFPAEISSFKTFFKEQYDDYWKEYHFKDLFLPDVSVNEFSEVNAIKHKILTDLRIIKRPHDDNTKEKKKKRRKTK